MKRIWKATLFVGFAAILAFNASGAFAQNGYNGYYGNGACGPTACESTCAVPACEPSCSVPTCEPACSVPACEPTCAPEACEPVGCGYYGGISCDGGYCGGCCDPCYGVSALVGGVLNVAVTPIHWVASMFTDGIYPGCGCAPAPAKTPCNPCDICGGYVGGCNDSCEGCGGCGGNYGNYAGGTVDVYGAPVGRSSAAPESYSVGPYDSESYDASPSRRKATPGVQAPVGGSGAPEALPAEAVGRGGYSTVDRRSNFNAQAFNVRTFDIPSLVGSAPRGVRQTSYLPARSGRYPIANAASQETIVVENAQNVPVARNMQNVPVAQNLRQAPVAQNMQNAAVAQNVQAAPIVSNNPVRKTYGQARPNQTTGSRSL